MIFDCIDLVSKYIVYNSGIQKVTNENWFQHELFSYFKTEILDSAEQ